MPDKLQELTDKLYQEGLMKGKQEAEEVAQKAKEKAERIIAEANEKAAKIVSDAEKQADDLKQRTANDVKMASTQTISALKQKIEAEFLNKAVAVPVKEAMNDTEFIKSLIDKVVTAFKDKGEASLDVILPDKFKDELDSYLKNEISKKFGATINVRYDRETGSGFKIGPKDGGYFISFTEGEFEKIVSEYLRPATRKLLFK
jgi:Archaeal/vacuolar-type H+-ATPase subunit E